MKNFLTLVLSILTLYSYASPNKGKPRNPTLSKIAQTQNKNITDFPSYVEFHSNQKISLEKFIRLLKETSQKNEWEFEVQKEHVDRLGFKHVTLIQKWKGKAVEYSTYHVHLKNDIVVSANGNFFSSISDQSGANSLSESQALNYALKHVSAKTYKWENPEEERHLKVETNDPHATFYPHGKLVYIPTGRNMDQALKLGWKFNIYASEPLSRQLIYVDANTGEILFTNDLIHHADAHGTAATKYSGTQNIVTDSLSPTSYRLRESSRGNGIITLNLQNSTSHGAAVDFTDTDNHWNNVNANQDEVATDAHWGAEMTYDYYDSIHSRNSIDGNGFTLYSYVHYNTNYANAFWDGQRMTYGDGNSTISPLTTLDIAGHEISHGLTTNTANLVYQNEPGALNESFSDIFGTAVEFFAKPSSANWTIGEQIGSNFRSMSDPNSRNDPDTYLGNHWYSGTADNGGVHTNSGVQNKWFHLLSVGGSGTNDNNDNYTVSGIGIVKAAKIAFRNLTIYLTATSNYADARFYAIKSAVDLYGACSPEVAATTNAWYAVGVGPQYVPYVLSAFNASSPTSCIAPHTVSFQNVSVNGNSFTWNFGDGTTSTQLHPTHTYNNAGTFNVTLTADGGTCGNDTTIKNALIKIGPNEPCVVVLPSNGTATKQTSCSGTIYDSGGSLGKYSNNESSTITIAPPGANNITLTFPQFDIEPGDNGTCNFDYLEIFDGSDINATSLGKFCNTTGNPGTVTSTGGAITIRFYSDAGLALNGFQANWKCSFPNVPPVANFTSNVKKTCSGKVNFKDQSQFGPTSWSWDFGDGNSSTQANPSHIYGQDGNYTVKLQVTNANGNHTVTKSSYIVVNKPGTPSVVSTSPFTYFNQPDTLIASGTGTANWYDGTGNNFIKTGDTLITPPLNNPVSYMVENIIKQPLQSVGPADNTIGSGGNFNNAQQYLIFDALNDMLLESVVVYSGVQANRTIELRSSTGQVLQTKTVMIPSGKQKVNLNFNVPQGSDYRLGLNASGTTQLYRNNSGPSYPYTINGLVSIKRSSANTTPLSYYYFFYDWKVREPDCKSSKVKVTITPNTNVSVKENNNLEGVRLFPNPVKKALNLNIMTNSEQIQIQVFDVTGKEVLNEQKSTTPNENNQLVIDLESLSQGTYNVRISTDDGIHNELILKY